jgi:restriction system protein
LNKTADTNLWGIHAGKTGDADSLFLKKSCVAVSWMRMGELSALKPDRDDFKAQVYPEKKAGAIPNNAGQLFRFVHEIKLGDLVVYPSKRDRQFHLGRVEGNYHYDPNTEPGYPHMRAVKWMRAVPRTQFSQGALYEIGSATSLFLVKNYADEFRAIVEGNAAPGTPVAQNESVAAVAGDIEQTTRDFVLKRRHRS